ncbi:hypothetical protein CO178_01950 [candidate division WWE3 bacterium CG_4_9_14_3_um_filter_34_6]|uniref:Uncharacterized protein n=1 Tax=candidate division WWE3 bacterium CG_4_9_14_3_um_filter_34_6 TaxID=1975079 RepID=A0A2M7X384_UNCKA|nr:MAG: hypothetical protein CO178_01950 [candidate division WWE3 bacterium CG_4_9_14_3_um_filter_34_6]
MENKDQQDIQLDQVASVPPTSKSLPKLLLFIGLVLILVAISISVGVQIGKNQASGQKLQGAQNKTNNLMQDTLKQEEEDLEVQAELIDPIEYSNSELGIWFKYPKSWSVIPLTKALMVCPSDYSTNEESARECFTIEKETRSFAKYIADLEESVGFKINFNHSMLRYSDGVAIYHVFNERGRDNKWFSISYITDMKADFSFVVTSSTPWNDYGYHLEPQILETIRFPGQIVEVVDWETYSNISANFSINYPVGWRKVESPNMVGFGPQAIPEDVTWTVLFYNKSEKTITQVKAEIGKQFIDREQTEETIILGNITATKLVTTTDEYPDWYSVTIIVEGGDILYVIGNGAQKDIGLNQMLLERTGKEYNLSFEDFSSSFRLNK